MSYWPLHASDAVDLTDPFFDMYLRQLPDCERAAKQRWGVEGGAYYPETTPFDGPVILPEDVAQEFQDVYLGRKKNTGEKKVSGTFSLTGGAVSRRLLAWEDHLEPPRVALFITCSTGLTLG